MNIKLREDIFGHWILVDAADETRAFTGERFVVVDRNGFHRDFQICNFHSKNAAYQYARILGFEVEKERGIERRKV